MGDGLGVDVELDLRIAAIIGDRIAAVLDSQHKQRRAHVPPGVIFPSSDSVVLTTGAPALGLSRGPLMGWAWRVTRIQISGAVGGSYQVYRDKGLGAQDLIQPAGAAPAAAGTVPVTAAFASAGNATATLPAGDQLASFVYNPTQSVGTANSVAVTVTGAAGGTQTYNVALTTGFNSPTQINFAVPLVPAVPGTAIAVTVTGNVNSPAGNITANGAIPGAFIFTPNGTYEPSRMWVRYPYAFNAVGTSVTTPGLLVVDFINTREDWLGDEAH